VTVSYHLEPLNADDTFAYINHRLKHASVGPPLTFPRSVTDIVHRHSRGVARMINVIADAILLYGYGADKHAIDEDLATEVVAELGLTDSKPAPVDDDVDIAPDPPSASSSPAVTMPREATRPVTPPPALAVAVALPSKPQPQPTPMLAP